MRTLIGLGNFREYLQKPHRYYFSAESIGFSFKFTVHVVAPQLPVQARRARLFTTVRTRSIKISI